MRFCNMGLFNNENKDYGKAQKEAEKRRENEIKLGVTGYDFECTLHEKRMSAFGGQKEDIVDGFCFVKEDRLIIKKFSVWMKSQMGDKVVPYANINAIDYDKAGKFHITSSIVISISGFDSIILKYTTEDNFRLLHDAWLNFNNPANESTSGYQAPVDVPKFSAADELLKYAELYERGLLTKEEFDLKKEQLLNQKEVYASEPVEETSLKSQFLEESNEIIGIDRPRFCGKCGAPIDSDSIFCSNCGNKLN